MQSLGSSSLPYLIEENDGHSDSHPSATSSSSSASAPSSIPESMFPHPPSTTPPSTNANFNPNFLGNPNYMNYMPFMNGGAGNNSVGFKNRTEDALSSG